MRKALKTELLIFVEMKKIFDVMHFSGWVCVLMLWRSVISETKKGDFEVTILMPNATSTEVSENIHIECHVCFTLIM